MQGTEKQVKWALDIQRAAVSRIDQKISSLTELVEESSYDDEEAERAAGLATKRDLEAKLALAQQARANALAHTDAHDWIQRRHFLDEASYWIRAAKEAAANG